MYEEILDTSFNYPGIDIYRTTYNGEFDGYTAKAQDGYVFYDANANDTELDPETMEERPVTYYYTIRVFSKYYNMANFSLVAVLRSTVDENYIFGVGDNDHEVM